MNKLHRRIIGVLSIGGGFLGISLCIAQLFTTVHFLNYLFIPIFVALFFFGITSGLNLIENESVVSIKQNQLFWFIQIPILMSPVFGYQFASGLILNLWFSKAKGLEFYMSIGSSFRYSLFQSQQPYIIGINLIALFISVYYFSIRKRNNDIGGPNYE